MFFAAVDLIYPGGLISILSTVNRRADRLLGVVRGRFRALLETAISKGTPSDELDVDAKAEILLGTSLSMNVVIRAAGDNPTGQQLASATAAMIRE